jgi:hypothetical protein
MDKKIGLNITNLQNLSGNVNTQRGGKKTVGFTIQQG